MNCVDDKFIKHFKSYLGKHAAYNFISSMIEESKYCTDAVKKHFNKELVMTIKGKEDFENSTKCWICDNAYFDGDAKPRDHCHINGKYRVSAHRGFNIKVKLNHKISVVFHNLNNYDLRLVMQELGRFSVKMYPIPNGSEKYMSFSINNKLSFVDGFQFLNSSLNSLIKN